RPESVACLRPRTADRCSWPSLSPPHVHSPLGGSGSPVGAAFSEFLVAATSVSMVALLDMPTAKLVCRTSAQRGLLARSLTRRLAAAVLKPTCNLDEAHFLGPRAADASRSAA